jgi:mannose-6-phosphate isomerase-like protein (cupin superfamily)
METSAKEGRVMMSSGTPSVQSTDIAAGRETDLVVVRGLSPDARPSWSDVTSAGIFRIQPNGRFDRHYHDCDEYWLVFSGAARVGVGTRTYEVGPGDIVCTPAGTEHDVVGVRETLEAFWFEGPTPPGGRIGHLHKTPQDAEGHSVPSLTEEDPDPGRPTSR